MDYSVGVIPMGAEEDCYRCVLYACWWAFIIFHLDGSSLYWGWPDDERFKDLVFFLLLLFFFFNFILTIALPPTLLKRRKDGMGVVYSEITPFWWVSLYSSRTSSYSPPLITLSGKHIAKKQKKKMNGQMLSIPTLFSPRWNGIYCRWFASKWDVFTMAVSRGHRLQSRKKSSFLWPQTHVYTKNLAIRWVVSFRVDRYKPYSIPHSIEELFFLLFLFFK
jgi:hypothetical protein